MLFLIVLCYLPLAPLTSALTTQSAAESKDPIKWTHLGNLSPYHAAPVVQGVKADLPEDCTVNQLMLVNFHYYFKLKSADGLTRSVDLDGTAWQSIPISHGAALRPTIDLQARKSFQCDPKG
jgi:hypothetical protein